MALIKCPECGREVSSMAVACPQCGYPIASKIDQDHKDVPESKDNISNRMEELNNITSNRKPLPTIKREEVKNRNVKNSKKKDKVFKPKNVLIIFGIVILFIIVYVVLSAFIDKNNIKKKAEKGIECMRNGEYETAYEIFSELPSDEYAIKLEEALIGLINYKIDNDDYENVEELLAKVKDNQVSSDLRDRMINNSITYYINNDEFTKASDNIALLTSQESIDNYNKLLYKKQAYYYYDIGLVSNAWDSLCLLKELEKLDSETMKLNDILIEYKMIDGKYIYEERGIYSGKYAARKRAAASIDQGIITFYHCNESGQIYEYVTSAKLEYKEKGKFYFRGDNVAYDIEKEGPGDKLTFVLQQDSFIDYYLRTHEKYNRRITFNSGVFSEDEMQLAKIKPHIGMDKKSVEESTWGKPEKINSTEYTWGTNEQWVYGNGRYIYFENGYVTAITDSK